MSRCVRQLAVRFAGLLVLAAVAGASCEKSGPGPKREDHDAAHRATFHPDIHRPAEARPTSRPAPPELEENPFESGLVGKQALFVNNETILVKDILEPLIPDLRDKVERMSTSEYIRYLRREITMEITNQISQAVVYQEAKHQFTEARFQNILEMEADDTIDRIVRQRFGGVEARYEAYLASLGFTIDEMKEKAKRHAMVLAHLRRQFMTYEREPKRRELMNYYNANIDQYTTPAKAEMFLIEVPIAEEEEDNGPHSANVGQSVSETARARAKARIERAREELESGIGFAAVAKTYSEGLRASNGGAWGPISPGVLGDHWNRPVEVLFTLEPGQISDTFEYDGSFFMVKCGERTKAHRQSFEEAQADIIARIKENQYREWSERYIRRLVEEAQISEEDKIAFARAVILACPRPEVRQPAPR